jgi:hypothetical protein
MGIVNEASARFDARPAHRASLEARSELGLTTSQPMAMVRPCTFPIDPNGSARPSQEVFSYHYVIVRALPAGSMVAQVIHAAGESASPRPKPGCRSVALLARDEAHLHELAQKLFDAGIEHHCVFESDDDPQYPGQMMAIGLYPRQGKVKVLSDLPLVK